MNENIIEKIKANGIAKLLKKTRVEIKEKTEEENFLSVIHVAKEIEEILIEKKILNSFDLTVSSSSQGTYPETYMLECDFDINDQFNDNEDVYEIISQIKKEIDDIFFYQIGTPIKVNFEIKNGDDIKDTIVRNLLPKKQYIIYSNYQLEIELNKAKEVKKEQKLINRKI